MSFRMLSRKKYKHTSAVFEHVPKLARVGGISTQPARQTDNGQGDVRSSRHLDGDFGELTVVWNVVGVGKKE